jgi:hypothetical protein
MDARFAFTLARLLVGGYMFGAYVLVTIPCLKREAASAIQRAHDLPLWVAGKSKDDDRIRAHRAG